MVKNLRASRDTLVQSLGQEDPLENYEWLPIPVFLPGEFYGQKEPSGLQSMGSQRVEHD